MVNTLGIDEIWVIATCAVCAAACAIPGVFLVLSRSSLLADGISHSALAGLGFAFIITQSRSPVSMIIGALGAGIVTAWLSSAISRASIIKSDAALGMVFTTLFSIGVIIITVAAREVDLDPGCILYGVPEFIAFDTISVLGLEVPRAFLWLIGLLVLNSTLCWAFWKELRLTIFDPLLAQSLGFHPARIHYGILACVTVTVVLSFEALGSILVVTMLVAPAAAAYLWSDRLVTIVCLAILLGVFSAFAGYAGALALNSTVAGVMSVVAGILFILAALLAPKRGIIPNFSTRTSLRYRIVRDDILGLLFRWHEVAANRPTDTVSIVENAAKPLTTQQIALAIGPRWATLYALRSLRIRGEIISSQNGGVRLSERGLVEARAVVRSHRLWESYLAKHLSLPADHLHAPSERAEHYIGRALAREIAEDVESKKDPHGKVIP
jgi:manganese/zinc/iron transport system permease protein